MDEQGRVIPMSPTMTTMDMQPLDMLLSYWERLRGQDLTPKRSAIDPRDIQGVLNNCFILEVVDHGAPRFRVAGMNICDLKAMELRGMQAQTLFSDASVRGFNDILKQVTQAPCLAHLELLTTDAEQKKTQACMQLLPMRDHRDQLTRILGAISLARPIYNPPVAFEITNQRTQRIISRVPVATLATQNGMRETQSNFQRKGAPRPKPGRPNLRLIK